MAPLFWFSNLETLIALIGAILGLRRWRELDASGRWLVLFLAGSAALNGLQSCIYLLASNAQGDRPWWTSTAWLGQLWTGFSALALLGALAESVVGPARRTMLAGQWTTIALWAIWCFGNPEALNRNSTSQVPLAAVTLAMGFAVMLWTHEARNPKFRLGAVVVAIKSVDLVAYALKGSLFSLSQPEVVRLWTFRNAAWCVAYALLAWSVARGSPWEGLSDETNPGSLEPSDQGPGPPEGLRSGAIDLSR